MAEHGTLYTVSSSNDSSVFVEVAERRLFRRYKYFLSFGDFKGELHYSANQPENSRLTLNVDATSIRCPDQRLRPGRRRRIAEFVRDFVLDSARHPLIQFCSHQVSAKALRGFTVEGTLTVCGATRAFKMNAIIVPKRAGSLEVEADSLFQLSDLGIQAPSYFLGIVKTSDQALAQFRLTATPVGTGDEPFEAHP
jgi:polyisoprenoid-binding protein YceI